jgi:hypothetical protein
MLIKFNSIKSLFFFSPYRFEIRQPVRYLEQGHFSFKLFTVVWLLNPNGRQVLKNKKK